MPHPRRKQPAKARSGEAQQTAAHFTPETMRFLRGLIKNNDRTWFEERRPVYERAAKAPLHDTIAEINAEMVHFAPEFVRPPHKIAMRIFRDIRFSPDKRPYKRHLSAWWAHTGLPKDRGAGFYLQIGPEASFLAGGVYAPECDDLLTLRRYLAEDHLGYRSALASLLSTKCHLAPLVPIDGNALTRNPKGFPADHPAGDLLRARNWGVTAPFPADAALSPTFAQDVAGAFAAINTIVGFLNRPFFRATTLSEGGRAPF